MSLFTKKQLEIANSLIQPKTLDELIQLHDLQKELLEKELEKLEKFNLIEKQGNTFVLKKNIAEEIQRKRQISIQDPYHLRVSVIIELQTVEEELLKNSIEQMKTRIEKNPTITIYSLKQEAIQKSNEENYSTFLEIEFSVKDFESLVKFVYFYGPSSIEILKPEKVEIENNDLQDALMFMADINYKYADLVTKNMNKRQLEEFYQSVFK